GPLVPGRVRWTSERASSSARRPETRGRPGRGESSGSPSVRDRMVAVRTPRKLRTNADLLVIGGGITGMSALAEARRPGPAAICLEARARPGGRIRTVRNRRIANYPIELGAEFVHGPQMKQLCESLGLTLVPHPSDGHAFVDNAFQTLLPILGVFQSIRDEA